MDDFRTKRNNQTWKNRNQKHRALEIPQETASGCESIVIAVRWIQPADREGQSPAHRTAWPTNGRWWWSRCIVGSYFPSGESERCGLVVRCRDSPRVSLPDKTTEHNWNRDHFTRRRRCRDLRTVEFVPWRRRWFGHCGSGHNTLQEQYNGH